MEQKAMLLGIELVDFTNEKGEQVKFTKLHPSPQLKTR